MRYRVNQAIKVVIIVVLAFVAISLIGARVDLSRNTEVAVEATSAPALTAAPAAVEDEFSSEAVASEETTSIELAMPKYIGSMKLNIPENGIPAYYYKDPDDSCTSSIRWEEIYEQFSAQNLGKMGFVTGPKAGQEYLAIDWVSTQVQAYGYEVVNATLVPSEARSLVENDFANFFVGKITRLHHNGKAVTMNCEPYEGEQVHHAVVNIFLGQNAEEYVTVFLRNDGVWTLCTEGTRHYDGPQPQSEQPQQTQPEDPAEDVDPAPVWEDPTDPTPVQPSPEPWDPSFNWDVDPAPVWEDPSDPSTDPTPSQDWDPDFNFSDNTDPAPVWEQPSENIDPAPVWEPVSQPSSDPVPSTVSDWDSSFNFSGSSSSTANVDPAPVWEAVSAPASEPVAATSTSWDAGFNFESSSSVTVVAAAPAAPVVVEYSAPAAPAAVDNSPAAVWDNPVNESSSGSASADDGWDSGFNF